MDVVYRGFDNLDVAFQGQIPKELDTLLTEAKTTASQNKQDELIEFRGVRMHVAETGARGGYTYRCDTGPDGATWFFKQPNMRDAWGVRVSSKALALALYGLGGTRARFFDFLDAIGVNSDTAKESIGRVDYAVDFLMPEFTLEPEHFVMHSRTDKEARRELQAVVEHGRSGRVTSVRVGMMPGRQVAVYDKRADLIAKGKREWWTIYNDLRKAEGKSLLDPTDPASSQIWRIEVRAGKDHLKDRWGISTWAQLDNKIGDVFLRALTDIRYTYPTADSNRSRWPDDPLWTLCRKQLSGDLFEMISASEPGVVKEIIRQHHADLIECQMMGLSATWGRIAGFHPSLAPQAISAVYKRLLTAYERDRSGYAKRMEKADRRYTFIVRRQTQ